MPFKYINVQERIAAIVTAGSAVTAGISWIGEAEHVIRILATLMTLVGAIFTTIYHYKKIQQLKSKQDE